MYKKRTSKAIITKTVVDLQTGEIKEEEYIQKKEIKSLKGGFYMGYKELNEAIADIANSRKEYMTVWKIINEFTYKKTEVSFNVKRIAKELNDNKYGYKIDNKFVYKIINRMVENDILMNIGKSYRINPFMYVPYKADIGKLQEEWTKLKKEEDEIDWDEFREKVWEYVYENQLNVNADKFVWYYKNVKRYKNWKNALRVWSRRKKKGKEIDTDNLTW